MSALAFIDARCALMIADAARAIRPSREGDPPLPARGRCRVQRGIGLIDIDGIRLVAADDR